MKKFLVIVAAIAVLVAWSDTASAQCNTGGRFFGGNQCGSGHVFGGRVFHSAPFYHSAPVYSYNSGCSSSGGYVIVGQPQPQPQYTEGKKAVMPEPNYLPYKGEYREFPAPAPKKTTQPEELPLPPKKIQPPNPHQEGFPGGAGIQIDGESYGRLPNGSYAKISDGTYSRLTGNMAYGSYSK